MTWQADKARWRKVHKGKLYLATCAELGTPSSKEASYRAANSWWTAKRAELDSIRPSHPFDRELAQIQDRIDWARAHGRHDIVKELGETADAIGRLDPADPDGRLWADTHLDGTTLSVELWQERLGKGPTTPSTDLTIGDHAARYLELSRARHAADNLSASELDLIRLCVDHFAGWLGRANLPNIITPDRWEGYWLHLLGELGSNKASAEYVKKRFRHARSFTSWLAGKGIILVPMNLHDRRHRFPTASRSIKVFSTADARALVDRAPGQLRLHLLLMLNCGFTQVDISDLHPKEVDWQVGRITRQRSKTRHHSHTPKVSYKLWAETFTLLQAHRSQDADRVLTTRQGKPWAETGINSDGKYFKRDAINSNFRHLVPSMSLKTFRATSATLLDGHRDFSRFSQHFLGHSGRSVAEKYYLNRDGAFGDLFDEAVAWLRRQYGFPPTVSDSEPAQRPPEPP